MFEYETAEPAWGNGDPVPDDDLDGELERLLADDPWEGLAEWLEEPVPDFPPVDWPEPGDEPPGHDPPATLGSRPPSGRLALDLDTSTTDPTQLSDHTLIEAMIGFDRLASWATARQARLLAELATRRPTDKAPYSARWAGVGSEYAPDEVGVALTLSRGTACARIGTARRLLTVLPETHALWETGRIDTAKARAVDDATWMLSPDLARAVQDRLLAQAPQQTLAQLKAALGRAVLAVVPEGAEQRHRQARRDRRVVITPEADGMASLWALLTATQAAGAFTWLTRLARGLGPDDPRSMDTRRADILTALLTGRPVLDPDATVELGDGVADRGDADHDSVGSGPTDDAADHHETIGSNGADTGDLATPEAGRPIHPVTPGKPLIQIVMLYSTLAGADDQPGELVGHGPIPAGLARETAADAVWHRLITDPLSGTLLDYGRSTYHPPAGLADHVKARDVYCRFPGCRRKAVDAELDHIVAWADGGTTSADNLGAYCTHHHRLKHHVGWHVHADSDGSLTWTTPTGHRHTTTSHDYRPVPAPTPRPERTPATDEPGLDPPPF